MLCWYFGPWSNSSWAWEPQGHLVNYRRRIYILPTILLFNVCSNDMELCCCWQREQDLRQISHTVIPNHVMITRVKPRNVMTTRVKPSYIMTTRVKPDHVMTTRVKPRHVMTTREWPTQIHLFHKCVFVTLTQVTRTRKSFHTLLLTDIGLTV